MLKIPTKTKDCFGIKDSKRSFNVILYFFPYSYLVVLFFILYFLRFIVFVY